MKKLLSLSMAAAMLLSSAAIAHADTGTIPLYADELNLPAIQTIPGMQTEHTEDDYGRGTTTVWLSMAVDSLQVSAYDANAHYNVLTDLDLVDGTSATYSTTGLKRQVGIQYSGGSTTDWTTTYNFDEMKAIEEGINVGEYASTDEMYEEVIAEYTAKGWVSDELLVIPQDPDKTSETLEFYVYVDGVEEAQYVGYYDVTDMTDDEKATAAENVLYYLTEEENYNPDALYYIETAEYDDIELYDVYVVPSSTSNSYWYVDGPAYYAKVGNQTTLHDRWGKVVQVNVAVDEDLFNTDMEFVDGTVTYKKNGTTGAWYAATVTMNYSDKSAVRTLKAQYLPTYNLGLQGYSVTINANGTSYVLDYNPYGGFEKADAYNAAGVYKNSSTKPNGSKPFDWVKTDTGTPTWKYVRNFSLLSLSKLKSLFTRLY